MELLNIVKNTPATKIIVVSFAVNTLTTLCASGIVYCCPNSALITAIIAVGLIFSSIIILNIYYVWNTQRKYKTIDVIISAVTAVCHLIIIYFLMFMKIMPVDRFTLLYLTFPLCIGGLNFVRGYKGRPFFIELTWTTEEIPKITVMKIYTVVVILVCIASVIMCILNYYDFSIFNDIGA